MSIEKSKLLPVYNHPYLSEEDPKNPYGINYEDAEYEEKIYKKFMKVKAHVILEEEDQEKYNSEHNYLFLCHTGASAASFIFGGLFKHFVIARTTPQLYPYIHTARILYYAFLLGPFNYLAYIHADSHFYKNISDPMLKKYLPKAIKNGFKDYQISVSEFEKLKRLSENMNA